MRYSGAAAHAAPRRERAPLDSGHRYVADATHLRRAERRRQVREAQDAGLSATCLLMPALPAETLAARKHAHRRSLLDASGLLAEGFDAVDKIAEPRRTDLRVVGGRRTTTVAGEPHRLPHRPARWCDCVTRQARSPTPYLSTWTTPTIWALPSRKTCATAA